MLAKFDGKIELPTQYRATPKRVVFRNVPSDRAEEIVCVDVADIVCLFVSHKQVETSKRIFTVHGHDWEEVYSAFMHSGVPDIHISAELANIMDKYK